MILAGTGFMPAPDWVSRRFPPGSWPSGFPRFLGRGVPSGCRRVREPNPPLQASAALSPFQVLLCVRAFPLRSSFARAAPPELGR